MYYAHSQVTDGGLKGHYTCWLWSRTDVQDKELISQIAVVVQYVSGKPCVENEDAVWSAMGC